MENLCAIATMLKGQLLLEGTTMTLNAGWWIKHFLTFDVTGWIELRISTSCYVHEKDNEEITLSSLYFQFSDVLEKFLS